MQRGRRTDPPRLPHFPHGELDAAIQIGAVSEKSVRVWIHDPAGRSTTVQLEVAEHPVRRTTLRPALVTGNVAAAELTLDVPAPNQRYRISGPAGERSGRLAPLPGTPTAFTFAFGSCHQPFVEEHGRLKEHAGTGMYPALARVLHQREGRFLLLLGDQVYSDGVRSLTIRAASRRDIADLSDDELLEKYRRIYRGYFKQPDFRSLVEACPACFVWDDHDIFDGWGSLRQVDDLDRRLFQAANQAYREFQHLRNPGATLGDQPPYHYSFWFGNAGFFVLDLRGCRDYLSGILLGREQFAALGDFLERSDSLAIETVFVVASVPLVHFAPRAIRLTEWLPGSKGTDVRDRWNTRAYQREHDDFVDLLFSWQSARPARQVILLSGDVHAGAAFTVRERGGPGVLRQWTSSPLTTPIDAVQRLANLWGTRAQNWGAHKYLSTLQILETHANAGVVDLIPLESGGHSVQFTLYRYDSRPGRLQPTGRVVARPRS